MTLLQAAGDLAARAKQAVSDRINDGERLEQRRKDLAKMETKPEAQARLRQAHAALEEAKAAYHLGDVPINKVNRAGEEASSAGMAVSKFAEIEGRLFSGCRIGGGHRFG